MSEEKEKKWEPLRKDDCSPSVINCARCSDRGTCGSPYLPDKLAAQEVTR